VQYLDLDTGRDAGLFAGVERIVEKFLEDDMRPILVGMSSLVHELLERTELGKSRGLENVPSEGGRAHCRRPTIAKRDGPNWSPPDRSAGIILEAFPEVLAALDFAEE